MSYNKDTLQKLLLLISDISNDPKNLWFKDELHTIYGTPQPPAFNDFPTFLKHLKRNYRIKAKEFYKNIKDPKLKNELVKDNVEMQWYQTSQDVERFLLSTFHQVENLLNYYCIKTDSYSKIEKDKNKYRHSFGPIHIICFDNFYDNRTGEKREIAKVTPIYAKIAYWLLHSNRVNWYSSSSYNMSNLIKIRNKTSHRSSTSPSDKNVLQTLKLLKKQDFSSLSFYINILKEIVKSIDELDNKSIAIQPVEINPSSKGPKILGKIDLPERKNRYKN